MPVNVRSGEIKEERDFVKKEVARLRELQKVKGRLSKEEAKALNDYELILSRELIREEEKERKALEERLHQARLDQLKEEGKYRDQLAQQEGKIRENLIKVGLGLAEKAMDNVTSKLDDTIDGYVKNIQVLSAHLSGTGRSLSSITDNIQNALSSTGLINQQKVFNNLTEYVKSGITYNVEQRAFLRTIADDISLVFDDWSRSMNQLVRIQGQDSTANRLALEYSLQEFLNENYKTSEYIKQEFSSISESLLTAQSTMTATNAMQFESIVQARLGSMYSAGMNNSTINSLASALNALGSGDISNLGSGISNLVLMGAARAGLDYGALLNNGLDANTTDKLLVSIASYMQEMGANQSNVVRSQLGNLFGVSITDLMAANNLKSTGGSVSTDISGLLKDVQGFTPYSTQLNNWLDNVMFSWGTNIAMNPLSYGSYKLERMMSSILGQVLDGVSLGGGILPMDINLGKLAEAIPLITMLPTLAQTFFGDMLPSSFNGFKGLFSGVGGLTGMFNSLGNAVEGSTIKLSEMGTSGTAYFGSASSTGDLLNSAMSSINDLTGSAVAVESEDEGPTLEENVMSITDTVASILDVLTERLESIDSAISDITRNPALTGWSSVTHFSV